MRKVYQSLGLLLVVITLPLLVVFLQFNQDNRQHAADVPSFYVMPRTESASPGEAYVLDVFVKTQTTPITTASIHLTYPELKVAVNGIETQDSPFTEEVETLATGGLIHLTRSTTFAVNGTNRVVTLHFTAKEPVTLADFHDAPGSTITKSEDHSTSGVGVFMVSPGDKEYDEFASDVKKKEPSLIDQILSVFSGK